LQYGPFGLKSANAVLSQKESFLTVGSVFFPFPPWQAEKLSLRCLDEEIPLPPLRCSQGRLRGGLPRLGSTFNGHYHYDSSFPNTKAIDINPFNFSGGRWQLSYFQRGSRWKLKAETKRQPLKAVWLKPLLPPSFSWLVQISGQLQVSLQAEGATLPTRLRLTLKSKGLSFHDADYSRVAENLGMHMKLLADHGTNSWMGTLDTQMNQGEVLFLPVYLPMESNSVHLQTHFDWQQATDQIKIHDFRFDQVSVGYLFLNGKIDNGIISTLNVGFRADLPEVFHLYGFPFLEGGPWEGFNVETGKASGRLSMIDDQAVHGRIHVDSLTISDKEHRIGVNRLHARLNWQRTFSGQRHLFPTSWISWHAAHMFAIPLGETDLLLRLTGDDLRLLRPATVPLLDGRLKINRFELLDLTTTPKVQLAGQIETVSLELLTRVLGLPPLAGTVSGTIPRVSYNHRQHILRLDGKLTVEVFDGTVTIENLVVVDLFGVLPRLQADIFFHDLDMELVTRHFSFGKITGRLEGYIKSIQLENWHPVSFDAWFGTPPDDTSTHRISQQAVSNLTDLGGGGTSGLISRTFLRIFEEFSYHRIGVGLRLSNNVCQLHGVAPAPNGYYIVTGGGLPRIDVIGYNCRIDWPTLLARLARITQIKPPVVQ